MLKSIPWLSILKSSFLAVLGWAIVSYLLWLGSQNIPALQSFFALFLAQPINPITNVGVGILIGAFALFLLEKSERLLTVTQLWILVLFLAVGMLYYHYSSFPFRVHRLLGISYSPATTVGIILGIFWCGKKHLR